MGVRASVEEEEVGRLEVVARDLVGHDTLPDARGGEDNLETHGREEDAEDAEDEE